MSLARPTLHAPTEPPYTHLRQEHLVGGLTPPHPTPTRLLRPIRMLSRRFNDIS